MAIQPITGKESYQGDVHPAENPVSLINQRPNGDLQRRIESARQTGGAWSATLHDGQGVVTERDDFDKNGASVAYTSGKDGTQTAQACDSSGKPQGEAVTSASPPAATTTKSAAPALPESTHTAQTHDGVQAPNAASNTDPAPG